MFSYTTTQGEGGYRGRERRVKVVAAGNGGIRVLDRIFSELGEGLESVAVNGEVQSLKESRAVEKVVWREGESEEMGREMEGILEGVDALILLGALGGGTAGRVLEALAGKAGEKEVAVFAVLALPFSFEGKERMERAESDLEDIRGRVGMAVVFPNDAMGELVDPRGALEGAFAESDRLIASMVVSLVNIFRGGGPMDVSAAEVLSAIAYSGVKSFFSHAVGQGENRVNEVVAGVFQSPLVRVGLEWEAVRKLLVHISAGPEISFLEVQAIFDQVRRQVRGEVALFFGISVGRRQAGEIGVSLIGSDKVAEIGTRRVEIAASNLREGKEAGKVLRRGKGTGTSEKDAGEILPGFEMPEPVMTKSPLAPVHKKPKQPVLRQDTLPGMEVVGGGEPGRFGKTKPTMNGDENLDDPTYIRKQIDLRGVI